MIAACESTREVRKANWLVGAALVLLPVFLELPAAVTVNSIASGGVLFACSCWRGKLKHRMGGGWSVLLHRRPTQSVRGVSN